MSTASKHGRACVSGVAPCKTVAEGMAWKFSDDLTTLTEEQWLALKPGVDMN